MTIASSSRRVVAGESAHLSGSVVCPAGSSAAGLDVVIYQSQIDLHGMDPNPAVPATTGGEGTYSFTSAALSANTLFRVHLGRQGAHVVVKVAPRVTLSGPTPSAQSSTRARQPRARDRETFTGTVEPFQTNALVALQIAYPSNPGQFRTVAYGRVGADGSYTISHTFATPGATMVRTIAYAGKSKVPAVSQTLPYEAPQPQNPALTIHVSADPSLAGQSLTINGVAAGVANQPITLLAHTSGSAFATVATTTTDSAGNYTFTRTPTQDTSFRVTDAAARSTTLIQRVRLAVTPDSVPLAEKTGQQIQLSGSLGSGAGARTVVLERENASGTGFQAVGWGKSDAQSRYSIPYVFARSGSYTMREKVPSDSANQTSTSEPFTVLVAP